VNLILDYVLGLLVVAALVLPFALLILAAVLLVQWAL
jgi:hypothetical protein